MSNRISAAQLSILNALHLNGAQPQSIFKLSVLTALAQKGLVEIYKEAYSGDYYVELTERGRRSFKTYPPREVAYAAQKCPVTVPSKYAFIEEGLREIDEFYAQLRAVRLAPTADDEFEITPLADSLSDFDRLMRDVPAAPADTFVLSIIGPREDPEQYEDFAQYINEQKEIRKAELLAA